MSRFLGVQLKEVDGLIYVEVKTQTTKSDVVREKLDELHTRFGYKIAAIFDAVDFREVRYYTGRIVQEALHKGSTCRLN